MGPNKRSLEDRLWARVNILGPDDCWEWQGHLDKAGYGHITEGGHQGKNLSVHRVAFEIHSGHPPVNQVLHRCDNRKCCNPGHLYDGTPQQNMDDKFRRGRHISLTGENHPSSKLTLESVKAIRSSNEIGRTLSGIYGVSASQISRIRRQIQWPV